MSAQRKLEPGELCLLVISTQERYSFTGGECRLKLAAWNWLQESCEDSQIWPRKSPPAIQLNTDATRISEAFTGSSYVQRVVLEEVQSWLQPYRATFKPPVDVEERVTYNPNLGRRSFGAVVALIDQITLVSVLLAGAALIRERERGAVEHLLVIPVTPFHIMASKIWSMGLVVLVASGPAREHARVDFAFPRPEQSDKISFSAEPGIPKM